MSTKTKKLAVKPAGALIIKVTAQPEKPYRETSARGQYWSRFGTFDGKPLADLEASINKDPPSQPKHGKLAGKTEPFSGWLSYFKAQGLVEVATK